MSATSNLYHCGFISDAFVTCLQGDYFSAAQSFIMECRPGNIEGRSQRIKGNNGWVGRGVIVRLRHELFGGNENREIANKSGRTP